MLNHLLHNRIRFLRSKNRILRLLLQRITSKTAAVVVLSDSLIVRQLLVSDRAFFAQIRLIVKIIIKVATTPDIDRIRVTR